MQNFVREDQNTMKFNISISLIYFISGKKRVEILLEHEMRGNLEREKREKESTKKSRPNSAITEDTKNTPESTEITQTTNSESNVWK